MVTKVFHIWEIPVRNCPIPPFFSVSLYHGLIINSQIVQLLWLRETSFLFCFNWENMLLHVVLDSRFDCLYPLRQTTKFSAKKLKCSFCWHRWTNAKLGTLRLRINFDGERERESEREGIKVTRKPLNHSHIPFSYSRLAHQTIRILTESMEIYQLSSTSTLI